MARATPYTNKAATVAMATLDAVVIGASILICIRGAPAGRLLPTEARDRPKSFGEPSSVRPVVIKPAISGVGMNHFGPLGGIAATFYGQRVPPKVRNSPVARVLLGKSAKPRG